MSAPDQILNTTITDFLITIPAETKQLLELAYRIYADGNCDTAGNGTWAVIIIDNKDHKTSLSGHEAATTSNRMEMTAVLKALQHVNSLLTDKTRAYVTLHVECASTYCSNTLREWIHDWVQSDFDNRKNADLLRELYKFVVMFGERLKVRWTSRTYNNHLIECDKLINARRQQLTNITKCT